MEVQTLQLLLAGLGSVGALGAAIAAFVVIRRSRVKEITDDSGELAERLIRVEEGMKRYELLSLDQLEMLRGIKESVDANTVASATTVARLGASNERLDRMDARIERLRRQK